MDKESSMIEVMNHLRSRNVQKAVDIISQVHDPRSAAWIGMGVMFIIHDDTEYSDVLNEFRTELELGK